MSTIIQIILFFLCNAIGFMASAIVAIAAVQFGLVDPEQSFNSGRSEDLRLIFFGGTMIVWIVCALFSIGSFFVKNASKYILVIAPGIVPLIYGLSVLIIFAGA